MSTVDGRDGSSRFVAESGMTAEQLQMEACALLEDNLMKVVIAGMEVKRLRQLMDRMDNEIQALRGRLSESNSRSWGLEQQLRARSLEANYERAEWNERLRDRDQKIMDLQKQLSSLQELSQKQRERSIRESEVLVRQVTKSETVIVENRSHNTSQEMRDNNLSAQNGFSRVQKIQSDIGYSSHAPPKDDSNSRTAFHHPIHRSHTEPFKPEHQFMRFNTEAVGMPPISETASPSKPQTPPATQADLESQIADLATQRDEYRDLYNKSQLELATLRHAASTRQRHAQHDKDVHKSCQLVIEDLATKIADKECAMAAREAELIQLRKIVQNGSERRIRRDLDGELDEAISKIYDLEEKLRLVPELDREVKNLIKQNTELEEENNMLNQKLSISQSPNENVIWDSLTESPSTDKVKNMSPNDKSRALVQQPGSAQNQKGHFSTDIEKSNQDQKEIVHSKSADQLIKTVEALQIKINGLEKIREERDQIAAVIKSREDTIEELNDSISNLQKRLKQEQISSIRVTEQKAYIETLEGDLKNKDEIQEKLMGAIQTLKANQKPIEKNDRDNNGTAEINSSGEDLSGRVAELEYELSEKESMIMRLQDERSSMLAEAESMIEDEKKINIQMENRIKLILREYNAIVEHRDRLQVELDNVKESLQSESELAREYKALLDRSEMGSPLTNEDINMVELRELRSQRDKLINEVAVLKDNLQSAHQQSNFVLDLERELSKKKDEIVSLCRHLKELERDNSEFRAKISYPAFSSDAIDRLERENSLFQTRVRELSTHLNKANFEKESLHDEIAKLVAAHEDEHALSQNMIIERDREILALRTRMEDSGLISVRPDSPILNHPRGMQQQNLNNGPLSISQSGGSLTHHDMYSDTAGQIQQRESLQTPALPPGSRA